MKTATVLLLVASLVANASLFSRWRKAASVSATAPIVRWQSDAARQPAAIAPETWAQLQPRDLPALVAQLRARGFPPAALRAIVAEQLRERFADRYQAITDGIDASPFWNTWAQTYVDPKTELAQHALRHDVAAAMRELLGDDAVDPGRLRRSYGDLPPDKLQAIDLVNADYRDLMASVRTNSHGIMLAEDRAQLALLEKEKRRDLERLLGPEGLELYELHASDTANDLRGRLSAFAPTEAEFRAIFRIKQDFTDAFGNPESLTPEERLRRGEAEQQLDAKIATALGAARFENYQERTASDWLFNHRFMTQQGLPPATTVEVMTLRRDLEQRAEAVRRDPGLNADQRAAQLSALSAEASARLLPTLGAQGLKSYRQLPAGSWIARLQTPPRAAPKS